MLTYADVWQVRDHRWKEAIVEARRDFRVNQLKLEAFESPEQQAAAAAAAEGVCAADGTRRASKSTRHTTP